MKNRVDNLAHGVTDAAKAGIENTAKVKDLKKFLDLDLEVFSSTAEADRKAEEAEERARSRCGGLLHPETSVSVVCTSSRRNQLMALWLRFVCYPRGSDWKRRRVQTTRCMCFSFCTCSWCCRHARRLGWIPLLAAPSF
jgi:hypothetical protein